MTTEILAVLDRYRATALAKDLEGHLALYDEQVLVFDMWGQWSLQGTEALRAMVKEWFDSLGADRVVIQMEDVRAVANQDLGYASAVVKYEAVSPEGKSLRWLQNRFTAVLERHGQEWKIVHQHTSGPADHQTLKVALRR